MKVITGWEKTAIEITEDDLLKLIETRQIATVANDGVMAYIINLVKDGKDVNSKM